MSRFESKDEYEKYLLLWKQRSKASHKQLRRSDCPRMYCWFWSGWQDRPDWTEPVISGCRLPDYMLLSGGIPYARTCCRASGNPEHPDYYEAVEAYLQHDGFPDDYFKITKKSYRIRKYQRRLQGSERAAQRKAARER